MINPTEAIAQAARANPTAPEVTGKIQFIEYHLPALPDGIYHINVEQTADVTKTVVDASAPTGVKVEARGHLHGVKDTFLSVAGPRFGLEPQEIRSVFPPEGSTGHHDNVLPHIILNRSTLPWERQSLLFQPDDAAAQEENRRKTPWLALLLFDESDPPPSPRPLPVRELMALDQFRNLPLQITGDHNDAPVTVIDVEPDLLKSILPQVQLSQEINELRLLTHVRQTYAKVYLFSVVFGAGSDLVDTLEQGVLPVELYEQFKMHGHTGVGKSAKIEADQPRYKWTIIDSIPQYKIERDGDTLNVYTDTVDSEVAVLIGNRLPRAGAQSTVHLVSLEHRYDGRGDGSEGATGFVFPPAPENVILVSLKSWRFACDEFKGSFKGLLTHLDCQPSVLRSPDIAPAADPDPADSAGQPARHFVEMGYTPLPHHLRTGDDTVSWYHGPLAPAIHDNDHPDLQNQLPARTADALVRYLPKYGMFEVSYAAAWELGRLLTLQSKQVATTLYRWKRTHAAALKDARYYLDHLPFAKLEGDAKLPEVVQRWFIDLALLRGAPFDYLVPKANMLPVESIRFFRVDPYWVECLLDGAFSIGRVSQTVHRLDQRARAPERPGADSQLSGFLLRSAVVSGWPDLQIDGYSADINDLNPVQSPDLLLPLVRMERLSPNVLLCLFAGEVQTVDIHLKPETLHFGVSLGDDQHPLERYPGGYYKELRNRSGVQEVEDPAPLPQDKAFADDVAALLDSHNRNLTAKFRSLLPNAAQGLTSLEVEVDKQGSEWRIYADQTVLEPKTGKQIPINWTYYIRRIGDTLTVHETLGVNVPGRAAVPLTNLNDPNNRRVLAIHQLQRELLDGLALFPDKTDKAEGRFTAAEFALEMVEGVQKVRFTIAEGSSISWSQS